MKTKTKFYTKLEALASRRVVGFDPGTAYAKIRNARLALALHAAVEDGKVDESPCGRLDMSDREELEREIAEQEELVRTMRRPFKKMFAEFDGFERSTLMSFEESVLLMFKTADRIGNFGLVAETEGGEEACTESLEADYEEINGFSYPVIRIWPTVSPNLFSHKADVRYHEGCVRIFDSFGEAFGSILNTDSDWPARDWTQLEKTNIEALDELLQVEPDPRRDGALHDIADELAPQITIRHDGSVSVGFGWFSHTDYIASDAWNAVHATDGDGK